MVRYIFPNGKTLTMNRFVNLFFIIYMVIGFNNLLGQKMRKRVEADSSFAELEIKKSHPIWCSRNYFSFLYNHCKYNNRTFLVPSEQIIQNKLNKQFEEILFKDKNKKLASFFAFTVRVLLHEHENSHEVQEWKIRAKKGFIVYPIGQTEKKWFYTKNELSVKSFANGLYLNSKRCPYDKLVIQPAEGYIQFNTYQFDGVFLIVKEPEKAYLINQLDIEEYIYSVLRWESWPGWPLEVNKAFAIACRSYLIAKVLEARNQNKLFHIKNTNIHQTYNGVHGSLVLKQAIDQTRGLILTYKKKPIDAMFDCCCGGIIPAHLDGINFKKAPYLARSYPCTFCKPCKIYSWHLEYSVDEFKTILADQGHDIKEILDIKITKKDKAGAVQEIVIQGNDTSLCFNGREFYSLLTKIKSFCYSIEKKDSMLYFNGQGYGHHLGICQWGARRMIDAGWNYRSILHFYYPGSSLMELKNAPFDSIERSRSG